MGHKHLTLDHVGGHDVRDLGFNDNLYLDFGVPGYFITNDQDDFRPSLPSGHCTLYTYPGPYKPQIKNHDTKYCFDPNAPCQPTKGMHTIHTGG